MEDNQGKYLMSIRTNYEKWYEGEDYYWGLEPGLFLKELIELCPPSSGKKVLDIGCGEGKDAVYMAQRGYDVTAFEKLDKITKKNGIVYINVFVEKSFLELPPDWDEEEKMWKSGELFTYFADWKIERIDEVIFEDNSGGVPHYHCMDTIICRKV